MSGPFFFFTSRTLELYAYVKDALSCVVCVCVCGERDSFERHFQAVRADLDQLRLGQRQPTGRDLQFRSFFLECVVDECRGE